VQAEIYKCTKDGKVEYANVPCEKDAKPAALKGNVTVVNKSAFVGKEGKDPKASVIANARAVRLTLNLRLAGFLRVGMPIHANTLTL
jgi:hypothetical protein